MKLDFSEISKGFDSALLKVAQNDMVSGDEALRILSRIQPTPENREAIERFKAYAAANPIPRSMLENTVNQLDPYIQRNMQAAAENKARTVAQKSLIQNMPARQSAAPAMAPSLPATTSSPQSIQSNQPTAQAASPAVWNPSTPAPPPTAPWSLWKGIKNFGRGVSDDLSIGSQASNKLNSATDRRDMLIEIAKREGNPQAVQAAKDEYNKTLVDVQRMRDAAYRKLPELNARQDAVENQNELAKLKAKTVPTAGVDTSSEYNPLFSQSQRNRGTVQPTGANQVQPINLPGAPATAPAPVPATASAPVPATAPAQPNPGFWEKHKYKIPWLGDQLKTKDTATNFTGGLAKLFGMQGTDKDRANQLLDLSKKWKEDPLGTVGNYGKNMFNAHPLLVGGGGLLLGGLALNSLFGKKKERQFGSPQGGGQNININLGGGAAPGMFGYHRAGVTSLGAPTGLTSNYGMDNKFGMDMVKHAGLVSTALGNVVKNRMANQAVDSLLHTTPKEERPAQPSQEEIEIAVKNPEVLKLLENEQNKAYLNRLLSEK
jgi:hypothetical protein